MNQLSYALDTFYLLLCAALVMWMGIRISEEEEYTGADISECGMKAYPEFTGKS